MIAIIDYGMGNIHSVQKALEALGAKTLVTDKPEEISQCEKLILPGVGAFDDAMSGLKQHGLTEELIKQVTNKKILLGICLGMQLFFEHSQEAVKEKGLGLIKGSVKKFPNIKELKVPHMGWNQLNIKQKDCPLLKDITDNSYVYFCHSYYVDPIDKNSSAATTNYGVDFSSIAWQDNIYGVQFHPEKSQETGLKILKNFMELKC
ncbi:MAG: imidazole glycerol phosphate synthase subunit HisH [Candidatus Omnitrophota bacterium]